MTHKDQSLFGVGMSRFKRDEIIMIHKLPARLAARIEAWRRLGTLAMQSKKPKAFDLGRRRGLIFGRKPMLKHFLAKRQQFAGARWCRPPAFFLLDNRADLR